MANFYDVNAAIAKPDLLASAQQGLKFGQEQRTLREQRADTQRLRELAPQVMAGDPGAFMQAAAIDRESATGQLSAGDMVTRRMEPLIKLMEDADSRDPREAQALWQAHGVPFVRQFAQGTEPTTDWQQAKPMLAQLKARIEMAKSSSATADPTGFRELHMKALAAGYQPGSAEYQNAMRVGIGTEGRASSAGLSTIEVENDQGGKDRYTFDPRKGTYVRFQEGGVGMAPSGEVPFSIDPSLPQSVQDAIRANPEAASAIPDGGAVTITSGQLGQPRPGVGMTPAARKYAEESSQQQAQIDVLPQRGRIEAQIEADKAAAKARAESAAESEGKAADDRRKARKVLSLLDDAEDLIPQSTGSMVGNVVDELAGTVGYSTEGAEAISSLRTIAGQLTSNMPRMEGPQGVIDVQLYTQMAGDLANPNVPRGRRIAALNTIRALNEKYANQSATAPSANAGSGGRIITSPDGRRWRVVGGDPNDPDVEEIR